MALKLLRDDDTITVTDADLVADGDKDVEYTLRHLTTEKHREIIRRHTKPGNFRRSETVNQHALADDTLDYVLVSWKGVVDGDRPAECDRAHKLLLDAVRKMALIDKAGMSELVEAEAAKVESFRTA